MRHVVLLVIVLIAACTPLTQPSSSPSATVEPTVPLVAATASPTMTPAPSPTRPTTCSDRDPSANVYSPERLVMVNPCMTVTGVVAAIAHDADGDTRVELALDYGLEAVLNMANLTSLNGHLDVRFVCTDPIGAIAAQACAAYRSAPALPAVGAHVQLTGPLVRDKVSGLNQIHPVWAVSAVTSPPVLAPRRVVEAQRLWEQIRAAWPAIPPAIIFEQDLPAGVAASASLQPDGTARLLVASGPAADAHIVWHEAGHVLHAVAMRGRGHDSLLYTVQDDVGIAYWGARGFPGTWGAHLEAGNWNLIAYEELAETFSAVNTGDPERTETYGVPLDRAAMLAFYRGLVPASR